MNQLAPPEYVQATHRSRQTLTQLKLAHCQAVTL
jgi:hypothetical protein